MEKMKLYGVQENGTIRNPTACEDMEHCYFFNSKILIEVMRSLDDVNAYTENENDVEADRYQQIHKLLHRNAKHCNSDR